MRRSIKITCYAACFILSFLLEGCISLYTGRTTFIDTGGAIANIGQKQARLRPDGQTEKKGRVICVSCRPILALTIPDKPNSRYQKYKTVEE